MTVLSKLNIAFNGVSGNVQGMVWMTIAGMIFAGFMALVKYMGNTMDPIQTSFLRYAFGLLFLAPFFLRLDWAHIRGANWKLHGFRGTLHGIGVMLWFYAMSTIPLAEVTAIGFTNSVFATLGAALFLGERIGLPRVLAVCCGLSGAILILRPGLEVVHPGGVAMILAALLFAGSDLCVKVLTRKEDGTSIVAFLSIVVTMVTLGPAIAVWQWPSLEEWGLMVIIAGLATGGHLCMTRAFKLADVSAIQPAKFLTLIWSALWGFLFFSEVPEIYTWAGAAIIVAAALFIARREAAARKASPEPL